MPLQDGAHSLRVALPELSTALDIGEQKGDGSGRRARHGALLARIPQYYALIRETLGHLLLARQAGRNRASGRRIPICLASLARHRRFSLCPLAPIRLSPSSAPSA